MAKKVAKKVVAKNAVAKAKAPAAKAKKKSAARGSPYSVHPGVAMEEKAVAGLEAKTGRSLDAWRRLLKAQRLDTVAKAAAWLKAEHGITTNYAKLIAERSLEASTLQGYDPDALVDAMFAGPKAALLPLYEALLDLALRLGADVTVTPCATIVPLRRKFVFAQIKPSTRTRLDLGLSLGATPARGRLVSTGGATKGDRITHRIEVHALTDLDDELKTWLRRAYESAEPA